MSPGTLLSTGYIAGGTIAGVLVAFLNFNDTAVHTLAAWQYRTARGRCCGFLRQAMPGLGRAGTGSKGHPKRVERLTAEIRDLNESQLRRYVRVPKGTTLSLPKNQKYQTTADVFLLQVAEQTLGDGSKASLLFDLNETQLKLPEALPREATLKIPQHNAPALVAFALMAAFLLLVGRGWLLKTRQPE